MHFFARFLTCLSLAISLSGPLWAQFTPVPVNNRRTTEVSGVTLQAGNHIFAAAMEGLSGVEETAVYRSTNGGPWVEQFRLGGTAIYNRAPDPVLAYDGAGTLYLEMMRIPPLPFVSHVVVFASTDLGNTWQLQSYPYIDTLFGDYPAMVPAPGGYVATSYSVYTLSPLDSWVEFRHSTDYGLNWSAPVRFDADRSSVGVNFITVGSDLAWVGNRLCLSYGDYNLGQVYFTSSLDSGLTWAPVDTIPLSVLDLFQVTKLVPWEDSDTVFYINHKPHDNHAAIHLNTSYDAGQSWTSQVVGTDAAYGEALQSGPGILDLVYNETDFSGNFSIQYKWSDDAGQTFSGPATLWTNPQNNQGAGEYQAFMPSASGVGFDLVFVDDSDSSKLKYLHFTHGLVPVGTESPQAGYAVFPNPTPGALQIQVDDLSNGPSKYRLCDLAGRILQQGEISEKYTVLDMSTCASGAYLLLLEQGNHIDVQRVIRK